MTKSFDIVIFINNLRKIFEDDDVFIEKSNGERIILRPKESVHDVCGMVVVIKEQRHIAIHPDHIMSIINKGDLY